MFLRPYSPNARRNPAQENGLDAKLSHNLVGFTRLATILEHPQSTRQPIGRIGVLCAEVELCHPLETSRTVLQQFKKQQFCPRWLLSRALSIRNRNHVRMVPNAVA